MLNIYICEDNAEQMLKIGSMITDLIIYKNLDMHVQMVTQNPDDIVKHLKERSNQEYGVYFLDIDLKSEMNGIQLGSKIREYDPRAYIVYITIHPELLSLTFKHKVEALDYISKTDKNLKGRISGCLKNINEKHRIDIKTKSKGLFVKVDDKSLSVSYDDILYIETSTLPHRIVMYTYSQRIEFYGSITDIQQELDNRFKVIHRSRIVNIDKLKSVDKQSRALNLDTGITVYASAREFRKLFPKV